jgi:ABC-type spermidine/putrescine transport system permease subunit II
MSPFLAFLFTLIGAICAWGLRRLEEKREKKLKIAVWIFVLLGYLAVVTGIAFTLVNLSGLHYRAAMMGGLGTLIAAAIVGLVAYRLVNLQTGRKMS